MDNLRATSIGFMAASAVAIMAAPVNDSVKAAVYEAQVPNFCKLVEDESYWPPCKWAVFLEERQRWVMSIVNRLKREGEHFLKFYTLGGSLAMAQVDLAGAKPEIQKAWNALGFDQRIIDSLLQNLAANTVEDRGKLISDFLEKNIPRNPVRATTMPVPSWFAKAGFVSAGVAFLFLIVLVIMAMFGRDVPSSARMLVNIAAAVAISCAFTFIGGTAQAEGKIPFFRGHEPIRFATTGGIAVFMVVLALLSWFYR
jgi:hypothetical protein